jgi:serine palmitoyltransferase
LEEKLQDKGGCKGKTFVVAEAISQRTGQMAPLAEIVALKKKYAAHLLLDETLSFGAYGDEGRGWFEQCGIMAEDVDAIMGSLEHATASVGGFCAGRKGLVEHQRLSGPSYLFSASCPPCALSAAIPIIDDLPCGGVYRRCALHENAKKVNSVLQRAINGNTALQLISDKASYVQHIRYNSQASRDEVEEMFAQVAADCAEAGINIQACSPAACIQEGLCDKYFDKDTTRPKGGADPSLRVNVSADSPSSDDLTALGQVLTRCFASLNTGN